MIFRFLNKNRQALFISVLFFGFFFVHSVKAMPVGTLLYRTSGGGNLYGYNTSQLIETKNGIIKNIYTGHVAIYVGKENDVDYIVEAMPNGLIKVPANRFINTKNGEELVGAKIPKNISEIQRLKIVQTAKTLAEQNLSYDFDFKKQKGPSDGEWTCVGLTEKIYESANISNPYNLSFLEYDPRFYAINITPDGFDNYSIENKDNKDCLSKDYEFSKISANKKTIIPFPELIGFNSGYEYDGERYFFFPLTQFWQDNLEDVEVGIDLSSDFSDKEIRGKVPEVAMIFKWSFMNNPLSSISKIFDKVASVFRKNKNEYVLLNEESNSEQDYINLETESSLKKNDEFIDNSKEIEVNKQLNNKEEDSVLSGKVKSLISVDDSSASFNALSDVLKSNNEIFASHDQTEKNSNSFSNSLPDNNVSEFDESEVFASSAKTDNVENFDVLKKNLSISKIYSTLSDDYIEIYNPNDVSIDLEESGVRLYKTKTSATPSIIIRIGNLSDGIYPKGVIIPAKGKYLIARSSASDEIKKKANAIANRSEFSFTGNGYTIYLSGGVVSGNEDEDIIDKVGFGSAKYFERFPAVEILDNNLLVRKAQSTSTPSSMKEGGSDFSSDNSYDSGNNLFDFVLIDLSINSQNNNQISNEINNDVSDNKENDTSSDEIDNEQQSENQNNQQAENYLPILISRIYATDKNDYIELYNPNEIDINLENKGYRLYKTKTGTVPSLMLRFGNLSDAYYPGGLIVPAGGKYLITRANSSPEILGKAQSISIRNEFTFNGNGYTIYLSTGVVSSDNDEDIIDKVGFGSATYYKVLPAPEILDNHILIRKAQADSSAILMAEDCEHFSLGNGFNSKNNFFDFVLLDLNILQGDYCNLDQNNGQDQNNNGEENSNQSNIYSYNYCLDEALVADNIINLWHFNECQGDLAYDFAGKNNIEGLNVSWVKENNYCSISHRQGQSNINTKISELFDSNNFTLLFKYKLLHPNSRPVIRFLNSSNDSYFQIQLYGSYSEFKGLPNVSQRLEDLEWPVGSDWHQFALVINKSSDYWSLYSDGVEVLRKNIGSSFITEVDSLSLVATGNETIFDEIVIFKKPLKQSELLNFYKKNLPFNSFDCQNKKFKQAENFSYFNFNDNPFQEIEDDKIIFSDLNKENTNSKLTVDKNFVIQEDNNFYLNIGSSSDFSINNSVVGFKEKQDLSLSLWLKRNMLNNILSPFDLKIISEEKKLFGIKLNNDFFYYFNDLVCQIDENINNLGLNDGNWHHLVLVYDYYRFELNLYIDGFLKKKINKNWLNYEYIDKIIISSQGNHSYLDELSLWWGILDNYDIEKMYLDKKPLFN